ncbi:MAG: hypothetical protein WCS89_02660 [Candidatus Paceibacterota bacterium]
MKPKIQVQLPLSTRIILYATFVSNVIVTAMIIMQYFNYVALASAIN